MSVELAGIPGAGKSHLALALAEGLAARGVMVHQAQAWCGPAVPRIRRLARKSVACGAAALGDPAGTARIVRALIASGQPGLGDLAGRLVQWLVTQYLMSGARRREGVTLLDEGLIQSLWSIGLRGDVQPVLDVAGGSPRTSAPDVVVVVAVPTDVALARLGRRTSQHSRTQLLPESERLAELERGARLLERLVEWCSFGARPPGHVLTVDGNAGGLDDLAGLLDRICASLEVVRRSDGTVA